MTPLCLVLSDDLLDASRVMGEARAAGLDAMQCKDQTALLAALKRQPALVVVDLHNPGLELSIVTNPIKAVNARVIAFGSHVDVARLKAARQAGCDEVMPRSAFFDSLATKLARWAGGDSAPRAE